jgi:hypothetical protein
MWELRETVWSIFFRLVSENLGCRVKFKKFYLTEEFLTYRKQTIEVIEDFVLNLHLSF